MLINGDRRVDLASSSPTHGVYMAVTIFHSDWVVIASHINSTVRYMSIVVVVMCIIHDNYLRESAFG